MINNFDQNSQYPIELQTRITFQVNGSNFSCDNVDHLLADGFDLSVLGVARLPLRVRIFGGESDAENSEQESIAGLDINVGLDQGLAFLDHRAKFVRGQVHTVEVGQDIAPLHRTENKLVLWHDPAMIASIITSLDIFGDETEFSVRTLRVGFALKICERDFEHTSLQAFRGDAYIDIEMKDQTHHWPMDYIQLRLLTGALCSVHQRFADLAVGEHRWSFHIVPVLTGEGINAKHSFQKMA